MANRAAQANQAEKANQNEEMPAEAGANPQTGRTNQQAANRAANPV